MQLLVPPSVHWTSRGRFPLLNTRGLRRVGVRFMLQNERRAPGQVQAMILPKLTSKWSQCKNRNDISNLCQDYPRFCLQTLTFALPRFQCKPSNFYSSSSKCCSVCFFNKRKLARKDFLCIRRRQHRKVDCFHTKMNYYTHKKNLPSRFTQQ